MSALRAGFSEIDITPPQGTGGPLTSGVKWPLRARVALFDDGRQRVAIVALDLVVILAETAAAIRSAISAKGGVAAGNILISCTHTHSGPLTANPYFVDGLNPEYLDRLVSSLADATATAAGALEPVELHSGKAKTRGVAFNRRPLYTGNEAGTHGPMWVDDFVGLEGPADEELQLLIAVRPDGGVAGGLVNFACHLHVGMGHPGSYSADVPGALCEALTSRYGGVFLFLQGASGNVSWQDMSAPLEWWGEGALEPRAADGDILAQLFPPRDVAIALVERLALALAQATETARTVARPLERVQIRACARTIALRQRVPTAEQVELAYSFLGANPCQPTRWGGRSLSIDGATLDEFNRLAYEHKYTFYYNTAAMQTQFAHMTIGTWGWRCRTGVNVPLAEAEIQVLSLGELAFVAYPAEMFSEYGLQTKTRSPFGTTVVCGISNGWVGYVPTPEAFDHGGYEPRLGVNLLVAEAGEMMTNTALELLNDCL